MILVDVLLYSAIAKGLYTACPLKVKQAVVNSLEDLFEKNESKRDPIKVALDGKFLSCKECSPNESCECGSIESGKKDPPSRGKRNPKCNATSLKKVLYVNGITAQPQDNCVVAKDLAEKMCSEVLSFYNSTDGLMSDLSECTKNIKGEDNIPARNLERYLQDHEGEEITIVAHSQGGIITRQALNSRRTELIRSLKSPKLANYEMSKIKIISCGTAEYGWPEGPSYTQYTNRWDPVPKVISEVDEIYEVPRGQVDGVIRHKFIAKPAGNIVGLIGHGMTDTYMPKIAKEESKNIPRNDCTTCPKKSYISNAN
jgi:hypothetical protein